MSSNANGESDSEDDPDYAPSVGADSESSDDERETKKARTATTSLGATAEDDATKKKAREELWATFQASVLQTPVRTEASPKKMVKVEKRYLFAGENVIDVVEVPEDSVDAKKWPLWHPPELEASISVPGSSEPLNAKLVPSVAASAPMGPTSNGKRPGPRKPKTSLPSLPTSSSHKARKLSTLDKSAMDWQAHINAEQERSGLKDELEINRKGGGYLEKVDFLKRVEERKEGALEASKSTKRRRQ